MTSIIIPTWNHLDLTQKCIKSIRETCMDEDYEIIVVDNASTDGSVEWLSRQPDILLIVNDKNLGFPKACNQGAMLARGDLFFLNNDTILCKGTLRRLREGLYADGTIGAVRPRQNADIVLAYPNMAMLSEEQWVKYGNHLNAASDMDLFALEYCMGFAVLIKRTVWDKVGEFDERFGMGNYEDNDYGLRILKAGYRNILVANCFIFHRWHSSWDKAELDKWMKRNKEIFNEKWKENNG